MPMTAVMSVTPIRRAPAAEDYVARSLCHERRMIEFYRRESASDGGLIQPLANACWRAASFAWAAHRDAAAVRRLWGEAARALARGWATRQAGFDPSPDQLTLGLHLSIAAGERDAFTQLACAPSPAPLALMRNPEAFRGVEAFRGARALLDLAQGYAFLASALVGRDASIISAARELLAGARHASERLWWERQFVEPLEAAWRFKEHEATCLLLDLVAEQIAESRATSESIEPRAQRFIALLDETLGELQNFVGRATDHHPKLYVWLPGVALCRLAASAHLPLENLRAEAAAAAATTGRDQLPIELL